MPLYNVEFEFMQRHYVKIAGIDAPGTRAAQQRAEVKAHAILTGQDDTDPELAIEAMDPKYTVTNIKVRLAPHVDAPLPSGHHQRQQRSTLLQAWERASHDDRVALMQLWREYGEDDA